MGVGGLGARRDRSYAGARLKVLLLGSGGRESALGWALSRSDSVSELVAAPGNPGLARIAATVELDPTAVGTVAELARRIEPDVVVVGPEAPLATGVGDALRADGRRVFGPDAAAARIESSKSHAKKLMASAGIPTARWSAFESPEKAVAYIDELGPPYVVKADGLAAGKGVVVTRSRSEAIAAINANLVHGTGGYETRRVVIEEFLEGQEISLIALTDGDAVVCCEPAHDYKRAFDGDRGPNTGGMGAYSPVPRCDPDVTRQVGEEIIRPMVRASADAGAPFVGAIYAGLVLTADGPKVLEFNARFGDPETQALLPRLVSDFAEACLACASGELSGTTLRWSDDVCVCVVVASNGYPGEHETGFAIDGLDEAAAIPGVIVFHAGTAMRGSAVVTAGGRVLSISATAATFEQARAAAYSAVGEIRFEGKQFRTDIALEGQPSQGAGR